MKHSDFEHGDEVNGQLVEPSPDATGLLEPADTLFDDAPSAIQLLVEVQRTSVMICPLVVTLRNDGLDAVVPQPLADTRVDITRDRFSNKEPDWVIVPKNRDR